MLQARAGLATGIDKSGLSDHNSHILWAKEASDEDGYRIKTQGIAQ